MEVCYCFDQITSSTFSLSMYRWTNGGTPLPPRWTKGYPLVVTPGRLYQYQGVPPVVTPGGLLGVPASSDTW